MALRASKKSKAKKLKPLIGQMGDQTFEVRFVPENDAMEGGYVGRARVDPVAMHGEIELADNLTGRGLINATRHEALHLCVESYGMKLRHSEIYAMSSLLCQMLLSTGLLKEGELEARLRKLGAL